MALTGEVWHGLQLLLPELRDLDGLLLADLAGHRHPLLVGVLHHLLEHVLGQRLRRDALIARMSGLHGFYVNARRAW